MQHERNIEGNDCKMKWNEFEMKGHKCNMKETLMEMNAKLKTVNKMKGEDYICWLSPKDAFTPTESWKVHISNTESPPPETTIRVLKKR